MKSRFTTIDICALVTDLQRFIGMRVNNIYDIDNKTYLIRLAKPDQKVVILIESGLRFHSTEFEWPKNMYPSGFAMKMRKHISGKRLVKLSMLGIDRILDFQFGSNEAAYHLIVELYDRGNIMLTDFEYTILNLLRTRTDSDDVRFAVRERYPIGNARQLEPMVTLDKLSEILSKAKSGDILRKILNPHFVFGPALLEHCLIEAGFVSNAKIEKDINIIKDVPRIMEALVNARKNLEYARTTPCEGFIIQKREKKPGCENDNAELLTYQEFHPFLFNQHKEQPSLQFQSFNKAVDEFFSKLESQKLDTKALQQEKAALKKLDNVKKDHEKRLDSLQKAQEEDKEKARLIEINLPLVDQAIKVVNSAIANQIDWVEINNLVKEARTRGDHVAMSIKQLKLETNHITMSLKELSVSDEDSDETEQLKNKNPSAQKSAQNVDIDLGLTAYANARRFYTKKRQAATKEQRTVEASKKALKSAEKKTKETLKEVATTTSIKKARKIYWFEKFFWFISSENYLVIGGRDQQQNEMIVKKHLKPGDVYVHADLHGASSIVIKNSGAGAIPPKTLNEAGCMATCYSIAWNERVITSAWWVYDHQVSKTAPTGEYLTTGSFMIRGKKNYLPPSYLILGFGFLFRLDETCIAKHVGERKVKTLEEENSNFDVSSPEIEENEAVDGSDSEDSDGEQRINEDNKIKTVDNGNYGGQDGSLMDKRDQTEDISTLEDNSKDSMGEARDHDEQDGHLVTEKDSDDHEGISDMSYPDTSIDLQYTSGGKYQFQRGTSYTSSQADDDLVDLGDGEVIDVRSLGITETERKQRLSAKQRRQMKKKGTLTETLAGSDEPITKQPERDSGKEKQPAMTQGPAKRGKKGKLKKMKEKYGDQDEEDRELMMRILGSAGAPKEGKGRRKAKDTKGRKGMGASEQRNAVDKKPNTVKNTNIKKEISVNNEYTEKKNNISNITNNDVTEAQITESQKDDVISADDVVAPDVKDDAEESKDNLTLLDSLTGCPFDDDVTLFAIPVCAPYGAVQNYKYRVKLTPGTGRRGKAARTALHSFIQSKEATSREKDLLKSVKDADLSRYIPGKVKISASKLKK